MRIVVSGGGTGGHIFPALALCESFKRLQPEIELLYIGSVSGMETDIVPRKGVPYQAVTARKLRKLLSISTVGTALSLVRGYREARGHLRRFRPDAVVGTGGYVAGAAALAGASLGIPSIILAPDSIPGRTNLMLARFAKRICVVFEETIARFPAGKTVVTGLPLRTGVVAPPAVSVEAARKAFEGLNPERFTVLVTGGSQGARAVNEIVLEALPSLARADIQVLHQTGPNNYEDARAKSLALGSSVQQAYCPVAFLNEDQVPLAYRAADIILCRGGISTLSEVMANALPAIVVPLPTAYADHQTANAQALARAGAALCYPQNDLHAEGLEREVRGLMDAPERLTSMSAAGKAMGKPDASDIVAKLVLGM